MDVGSMIIRENFYKILQDTLTIYYQTVRNEHVECGYEPFEGSEELRIYTWGNIVSRANKPQGAKEYFKAEYNVRNSFWKYVIGKLLVQYLMLTKKAFSPKAIYITKGVLRKNEFIAPQNRSIRVYDYDKKYVDCIIKQGFTNKYFNNQIAFRKQYKYDFMVPLIDSGDGWFREPILYGHPLARVTNEHHYKEGIETAIKDIQQLAKDTLEFKSQKDYISELLTKAKQLTEQAKEIKKNETYGKCLELLSIIENVLNQTSIEIPTCVSHGDLQTGNIWLNKDGKLLIYDWETAARRSVWYDSATLLYSLRRVYGWGQFMNDESPIMALVCDPIKQRTIDEFNVIKHIVLLEDYMFLIEDMMELPQEWGSDIFDGNINRVYQVVKERRGTA